MSPGERFAGIADDFHLVRTRDGFYTAENGTGRRLGELAGVTDPNARTAFAPPALWNARLAAGGVGAHPLRTTGAATGIPDPPTQPGRRPPAR